MIPLQGKNLPRFIMNKNFHHFVRAGLMTIFASTLSSCSTQTPAAVSATPPTPDTTSPASPGDKISIKPEQIINESARGDAGMLFDEQELSGDPRGGKGGKPQTVWTIGYEGKDLYYPLTAIVDLGATYHLSNISIYDTDGSGELRLESGTPKAWQPLLSDPLANYGKWNGHSVNVKTRYLHVIIAGPEVRTPGIVLYGTPEGPVSLPKTPEAKPHILPTMGEFIGTNAFIDDPHDKMAAVGYIRWNFDEYYTNLKAAGIVVAPSIKGSASWIAEKPDFKPVDIGQDAANPASYKAHADHLFQFAARYGSTKVADVRLKLASNQPRVSGLNLIRYFENGNEPNAFWHGRGGYATPYELAALCSADYDGHRKTRAKPLASKTLTPRPA